MNFARQDILAHFFWIVPLMAVLFYASIKSERSAMERFASGTLLSSITFGYSPKIRAFRMLLSFLGIIFLVLALSRPQWGFYWKNLQKEGLDIIFALDTSKSMLAEDFTPNRLDLSKKEIRRFVGGLRGDRVGLVAFAGEAFLFCPLTTDYSAFLLNLDNLDVNAIPVGGTAMASAINVAVKSYEGACGKNKVLILISDGEDHERDIESTLKNAGDAGVMICTIGIGSPDGVKVMVRDERYGSMKYLTDASGNDVVTKLEEDVLMAAADATGGIYIRADTRDFGFETIKKERLSKLEPGKTEEKRVKVYSERFYYPLAAALFFFLAELYFRGRPAREKKF